MKKISFLKSVIIVLGGLFLSLAVMQCTKVGFNASQLNRVFQGIPDSTQFSPFYDSTIISTAAPTPDVNDVIIRRGVLDIITGYCGSASCHGGAVSPTLTNYAQISALAFPLDPVNSPLWQVITTNDLNKAMPPVGATNEMSETDKATIYNWIKNGLKQYPDLGDFRPAAIHIISNSCTSGNCHSVETSTGSWARKGLISVTSTDTTMFTLVKSTGTTYYCQLTNSTLLNQVWSAYKDSVRTFYADTLANASFRPYKTFSTPVVASSVRGSLSSYDDLLMDIWYPKSLRSSSSVAFTSNGQNFYVKGNYLNSTSTLVSRIDSSLLLANPFTGVYAATNQGDMAYNDGGLSNSDIAIIKAWYFADPNIPDVWKYGQNNSGIFKYRKSGTIITKH